MTYAGLASLSTKSQIADWTFGNYRTCFVNGALQHRGFASPTLLSRLPSQGPQRLHGTDTGFSQNCARQVWLGTCCMCGCQPPARVSCPLLTMPDLLSGTLFANVTCHAFFQAGAHRTDKPVLLPCTVTPNA